MESIFSPGATARGNNSNGLEIDTFAAEPSVVRPGESAVLTVSVDGEGGDLTYRWRAAAGTLSARDTNPVTWTAPSTVGSVPIQVEVSSAEGMTGDRFRDDAGLGQPDRPDHHQRQPLGSEGRERNPDHRRGVRDRRGGKPDRRRRDGKQHSQAGMKRRSGR
ncbi:MAG: hypothetical protein MPW15_23310 [Candidatus Manganitrophus sp.]|nr:hypothetical protein [Candidatus Manganitrophus sp.]